MKALLAQKVGMTQVFDAAGKRSGVTVLQAGPCVITQLKTAETDGYTAVQIGFGEAKKPGKAQAGHLKKAGKNSKHLAEVRTEEAPAGKVGDTLTVDQFKVGENVTVQGVSKGKGFAGTIKRHNFNTGPKTHGSHNYRAPGSIGAGYPQHVFKGIKMAGQMGHDTVTIKNQAIIMIDAANNLIALEGSVPGPKKGIVMIKGFDSVENTEEAAE